jgi:hypothetical protein
LLTAGSLTFSLCTSRTSTHAGEEVEVLAEYEGAADDEDGAAGGSGLMEDDAPDEQQQQQDAGDAADAEEQS